MGGREPTTTRTAEMMTTTTMMSSSSRDDREAVEESWVVEEVPLVVEEVPLAEPDGGNQGVLVPLHMCRLIDHQWECCDSLSYVTNGVLNGVLMDAVMNVV